MSKHSNKRPTLGYHNHVSYQLVFNDTLEEILPPELALWLDTHMDWTQTRDQFSTIREHYISLSIMVQTHPEYATMLEKNLVPSSEEMLEKLLFMNDLLATA